MDYIEDENGGTTAVVSCAECNELNYVYLGRMDDYTYATVEGAICFACKHEWLFDGWEEYDPDLTLDTARLEEGTHEYKG